MIIGIGTDITDCRRIKKSYERFGQRFLDRICTEKEQAQMPQKENVATWLAARFAVKEAAVKALGTGFNYGVAPTHVEVLREKDQAPQLFFHDKALEFASKKNVQSYHVTYSHEQEYAVAFVILEG